MGKEGCTKLETGENCLEALLSGPLLGGGKGVSEKPTSASKQKEKKRLQRFRKGGEEASIRSTEENKKKSH